MAVMDPRGPTRGRAGSNSKGGSKQNEAAFSMLTTCAASVVARLSTCRRAVQINRDAQGGETVQQNSLMAKPFPEQELQALSF